ncbi:MAG TPA: dTMP kinase [Gaiellaceae bacterium]|nr:dTMP kinase [Gaiellaceae bacterium]
MFVTFEGIDGSGKTTQVELLRAELERRGHEVVATREPGGTELGEGIRQLVLHGVDMAPWAEACLYAAARAELVAEVIVPALDRGADVVCDRYVDSSLAYQGGARGLGLDRVLELNLSAVSGLLQDRTFLLALDAEEALARVSATPDRIEREGLAFMQAVERAYRELAATFAQRIVVLDGTKEPEETAQEIRGHLGLS